MASNTILGRFRQGLGIGVGLAVLVYGVYFVRSDFAEVAGSLGRFAWGWLPVLLLLSLGNYAIRFLRWELYLRMLDIRVPLKMSLSIFLAGLAMSITPGKVGEFLKSYLLKEAADIPMARSAPVVFVERVGDLLSLVLLASFGVATYGGQQAIPVLLVAGVAVVAAIVVLHSDGLSGLALSILKKAPLGDRVAPKIEEALDSSRALLGARSLVLGLLLATLAWYCECLGYWFAFGGFGIEDFQHSVAVFAYSFSTVLGVVSPGGLGPTDVGLIEIALRFSDELTREVATAASFLVRVATLWFAVGLGAIALMRFRGVVDVDVDEARNG